METNLNNTVNNDILEQLRKDYSDIKEQLNRQEIVNERLLRKTFKAKVDTINRKAIASVLCGVFVILIAPFAFHYNPAMNLSWAFVIGTDLMMLYVIYKTWAIHKNTDPTEDANKDLLTFAKRMKKLKKDYKEWTKVGFTMIGIWILWMGTELYINTEDTALFYACIIGVAFGGIVGSLIGLRMNKKITDKCDEIIESIEDRL